MRTIAFDPEIGMIVNSAKAIDMLTDLDALVSKIEQRLRFFLEEWFLDTTVGIAYFQEIFEKPVDPALIISLINADINLEKEVASIQGASFEFDRTTRQFSYSATIISSYGVAQISSGIVV